MSTINIKTHTNRPGTCAWLRDGLRSGTLQFRVENNSGALILSSGINAVIWNKSKGWTDRLSLRLAEQGLSGMFHACDLEGTDFTQAARDYLRSAADAWVSEVNRVWTNDQAIDMPIIVIS